MRLIISLYLSLLIILVIYSYGFIDPNLPFFNNNPLFELVFFNRPLSTAIFTSLVSLFFIFYFLFLFKAWKKQLKLQNLKWVIGLTVAVLLFSYPAFSYDIFNYILTAKVQFFYKENPYIIMPIEFSGDPNLDFTRAANKIALYGPSWIALTALPHMLSFNNVLLAIFSFKFLVAAFYLGTVYILWLMSKNILVVSLFTLNPAVIIETLVSSHNDIVMMFLALVSFYAIAKKRLFWAAIFLFLSILVKYATIFLLPVFVFLIFSKLKKQKINWNNIFYVSSWLMLIVFLLSPLREEIYPWYIIWPLSFVALVPQRRLLLSIVLTLSISVLLRYIPELYTGSYSGITPTIRTIVTFTPLFFMMIFYAIKKRF